MRKIIIYIFILVILCFAIPSIFVKSFKIEQAVAEEKTDSSSISQYNYKEYDTILLLHKKTNEVENIKLDEYLYGVVAAEMPVNYEMEALKAQAIVARTYTIYKLVTNSRKHENADICDDSSCCQAWISKEDRFARWDENMQEENWRKITDAVNSTAGKIITYNNQPINAFFHSNSGGRTEIPINVWGGNSYPYLQIVETSGEENYNQYYSEIEISNQELIDKLSEKYNNIEFNNDIQILEYTDSGRVKTIKIGNLNLSGVEVRTIFGLKSTNFKVEVKDNKVKFYVIGYGHGVGLSQTGSDSLAKKGKNCEDIIKHFYQGVEIIDY